MYLFYFIVSLTPISWIISIFWLRKWKPIYLYAIVNLLLIVAYFFLFFYSRFTFFKEDQLGLKKVFLFIYLILFHSIISFIFALYFKFKMSKNAN